MPVRHVGVVLAHPELEEGLEAVFEAGLGGVVAAHAACDPPDLVVLVGPGDLELQYVGRRVGGRGLPAGLQGGGQCDGLHRRSDLPAGTHGQVHLGVGVGAEEVAASHHGQYLAGPRLQHHYRGVGMSAARGNI